MDVELAEDLSGVEQVSILEDPSASQSAILRSQPRREWYSLLRVPGDERKVEDQWQPVSVDQEQEGQERLNGSLGDDVGVETVAELDRVDVVTVKFRLAMRT